MTRDEDIRTYGFTALPRPIATLLAARKDPQPVTSLTISDIPLPSSPLVAAVLEYAKHELPIETFNHSMRVLYYGIPTLAYCWQYLSNTPAPGLAIARFSFPDLLSESWTTTYLLTSLLHDIGTTDTNISATLLSFEFHSGLLVLDVLQKEGAPKAMAESVAEAVIRHQDLGETGTITSICAVVQLATIFGEAWINSVYLVQGEWGWQECGVGASGDDCECHQCISADEVVKVLCAYDPEGD
ncbi:hypothetical protein V495_00143 [Pseudogymnoascus sp. VKM F-4514 (FW-929)]|nr:hypothetical protein V495_00143 [Pseudogymnoascus sp. VKM F-4514 (FW-929)]KFY67467.1 hypothetical protein V497_00369 [Pseudogymnoascus sp. VKM F-4516 (FW-969)]